MARAADVFVQCLVSHGVDRVFCVPGESYLSVIDALYDAKSIDVVTARQEGGGALMAIADAKLTGRAGVMFVSRGPGAMNAALGIHVAQQDAVPLVLFVGQVAREDIGRNAFQEVDYSAAFGKMTKWAVEITDAAKLAESVRRAFHIARSGTPGPVVVSLPEDMLNDDVRTAALGASPLAAPQPDAGAVQAIAERLAKAERPLIIAGGQIGLDEGRAALRAVAEAWRVPVALSFRHQDLFDNRHPLFSCHLSFNMPPVFRETLNEADLIIAVGTRLGDVVTQGYRIPEAPRPTQPLIHIYPDAAEIGRNFETTLGIAADATATLQQLARLNAPEPPRGRDAWTARAHALAADRMKWDWKDAKDGVVFGNVIQQLGEMVAHDAVISVDAGNFSTWAHRLFPFRSSQRLLGAVAGSMGVGIPFAVAGALREPRRQVVCLVGDGGFHMTGNELSVAVERKLPLRVFVSDNGSLGTIRLYQERDYPGRTLATNLRNPDFAALAVAHGARGLKIQSNDDIQPVVSQALSTDGPVVVQVKTSLEYIAAYTTMSALRK
jgi:acetolactate synthase I/II/III large subunit